MKKEQSVIFNPKKVFEVKNGELFIGGEKIKSELRAILKEQASYLNTSQLWEIVQNTVTDECIDLSLNQSTEWNHIIYAKALRYYGDMFKEMIQLLKE
jgi:hypothetical protein